MIKQLWFDSETTGLYPVIHDIIHIAGLVQIDGKVEEEFEYFCQPFSYAYISDEAMEKHGLTLEQIREFPKPQEIYKKLVAIFDKYIDRYDKQDKFIAAGQNVRFDLDMLSEFFKKNGNNYCFSYFYPATFDVMNLAVQLEIKVGKKLFSSYKLEYLCKRLNVEFEGEAHGALDDIRTTKKLAAAIWARLILRPDLVEVF